MLVACMHARTDGVNAGLDFERALKAADDEGARLVKFQGSPQVRIWGCQCRASRLLVAGLLS